MAIKFLSPDNGLSEAQVKTPVQLEAPVASHCRSKDQPPVVTPPDGQDPSPLSLLELPQALRAEQDRRQTCFRLQEQLHQVHLASARTSRLLHTARSVQRTLGECIKAEDKHTFVNLFNSFHDALSRCTETTTATANQEEAGPRDCVGYPESFLDALPPQTRHTLVQFITNVRTDGHFIADRLAVLNDKELISLLPSKGQSNSGDSVFGSSPRASSRTSGLLGFVADGQTDLLSSFEYGSSLEALVYAVRQPSDVPLNRDAVATETWSTVSARMIQEQKSGGAKLVAALIDMWAASTERPGKGRLGLWIAEVLQNGAPLLEQASKQSFRIRSGGHCDRDAEDEVRAAAFYAKSMDDLFSLLSDPEGASVIPEGARMFCKAIFQKLGGSSAYGQTFSIFVLTRWLFLSYLPSVITLPEAHGLLTDHFISDTARQRLLREIASRAQKAVWDVACSWKHGASVTTNLSQQVRSIAARFEVPQTSRDGSPVTHTTDFSPAVVLSSSDISTLTNALYPQRTANSASSEHGISRTGLESSASSISGFSLFQPPHTPIAALSSTPSFDWITEKEAGQECVTPQNGTLRTEDDYAFQAHNAELLRQACNGIDDFLGSRSLPTSQDWCVLVLDRSSPGLCTPREAIRRYHAEDIDEIESRSEGVVGEVWVSALGNILSSERDFFGFAPDDLPDDLTTVLHIFRSRISEAMVVRRDESVANADYLTAFTSHDLLTQFHSTFDDAVNPGHLLHLLEHTARTNRNSLERAQKGTAWIQEPLSHIRRLLEFQDTALKAQMEIIDRLRDKMWYVAEARTSAVYDEARSVASALKVMGKPKKPQRTRAAPPLRHWNGAKASSTAFHLKSEAQVLELLSAPVGHGGPNKLSDDQAKALTTWIERHGVQNLCTGEERIQRLCMEVRRALVGLTVDGSTTWSSALFAREHLTATAQRNSGMGSSFLPLQEATAGLDMLSLHTNVPPSIDSISSASSHPLSAQSSRDYLERRSPTLTARSSLTFWSPAATEARSPSSATSIGTSQARGLRSGVHRRTKITTLPSIEIVKEQVRQRAASLLLSDLGFTLFSAGSETDLSFWSGIGGELADKHLRSIRAAHPIGSPVTVVSGGFDFETAFEKLFRLFASAASPFVKLKHLASINGLLVPYMADRNRYPRSELLKPTEMASAFHRTATDPLPDTNVEGFRLLLSINKSRRTAIFRDLQYIAAIVPSEILGPTQEGKAFWNAATAALRLKQETSQIMIETADSIIAFHANKRGLGRTSSVAQQQRDSATFSAPSRTPSAEDIGHYTMAHAAELLQIAAKEGEAVAQRELATLYLTHPDLMDPIIAPLSRPRDVFKDELESKWRKNQDPARCDPATMCVAHHWMSLSSRNGDALAKEYLRQRDEMDRLG